MKVAMVKMRWPWSSPFEHGGLRRKRGSREGGQWNWTTTSLETLNFTY